MSTDANQSHLRGDLNERASAFTTVLRRIGCLRENADWHRPKRFATIARRRNRISSARGNVIERFAAYLNAVRSARPQSGSRGFWIAVVTFVVLLAAVLAFVLPSRTRQYFSEQFTFPLPRTFLSEQDGIARAREALSRVVRNPTALVPIRNDPLNSTVAPDGKRDVYLYRFSENSGNIAFVKPRHTEALLIVELELRGDYLSCKVTGTK